MFEILEKYNSKDHFFFQEKEDLGTQCNAPKNGIGVYLAYALRHGRIELIYIGSSGKIPQNGKVKKSIDGLSEGIVNGKQFNRPRNISWKSKLKREKIEALDVYWYQTFDENNIDIPENIKGSIIQSFFEMNGRLPIWNKEY